MARLKVISGLNSQPDGVLIGVLGEKVGLFGATPVIQPANANQAVATDAASVIILANGLRSALVTLGVIKGSA